MAYGYAYTRTNMWQGPPNIGLVTGPGGLFAARLVTESRGLATNPPFDKPIEDCSTLHRGPRQGSVREGPRQKVCNRGGDRDKPLFRATPMCTYYYK